MSKPAVRTVRRLRLEALENRLALATLFVSPSGSDSSDGSVTTPWQTLQKAANVVKPGDTVIASPGDYVGFDLRRDGTAAAPITFAAEPGARITTRNTVTPDGINLEGADYIVIKGFTVDGMPRAGIRSVINNHVTIRNNATDLNGVWGIFTGFSDDLLIEDNITSRSQREHGIYVSNSGDRPVIRNNTSFGNRGAGIHMNGDISQGGDGIISAALVEGNTIYNNGLGGGSGINADGVQGSRFQNNLLYGNHASGISLFQIDGGAPSSGNVVVNNTIVQAVDGRWALNIQNASVNNTVRNNILYNNQSFRGSIDVSPDSLPGFTSDYNVVMDRFTTDGGDSRMTLAQWTTTTGQDQHSLVATPTQLFVNALGNDYHLSANSPALNVGTASNAPSGDIDGDARPSGAGIDVGADERVAAAPVNQPPIGVADSFATAEDSFVNFDVLLNDTDSDGGALTVATFTQPASGTLVKLTSGLLRYTPAANFVGGVSFSYQASDGQSLSAATSVALAVSTVNDAPVNSVPARQTVQQGQALPFSAADGNAVQVGDVDAEANPIQVDLIATNGTVTLGQAVGITFVTGDGEADASVSFRGSISAVTAALEGLRFTSTVGFSGEAAVQITTSDLGNTGVGGDLTDTETIAITVQPAPTNQAPTDITLTGDSVAENSSVGTLVGSVTVTDPDMTDSHSLMLIDDAEGRFGLSGDKLVVADTTKLDYEQSRSHTVTIRATDGDGLSIERSFTISVSNLNEVAGLNVQQGAAQRSYIRTLDLVFEDNSDLGRIIAEGRVQLMRDSGNSGGSTSVDLAGKLQAVDNRIAIDFGVQGIGGNRNSPAGNGNYTLRLDLDGDGAYETTRSFFRLLGDANGDRAVNFADLLTVATQFGRRSNNLGGDLNGSGGVDAIDLVLVAQQYGKKLRAVPST